MLYFRLISFYCIRFDLDFARWVVELGWFTYWNAMYVVMIAMVLHTLNSALMMYATFTESTSLLVVSMIFRFELVVFTILRLVLLVVFMILKFELLSSP
jgi:hypothetical protein